MSTALIPMCANCGRPVIAGGMAAGPYLYHFECTRSPSAPPPPNGPVIPMIPALTEADVRRIVREELDRAAAAIAKEKQP